MARRLHRVVVLAALTVAAMAGVASAASAATLTTTVTTATPEQTMPVQLTFSGTADPGDPSYLYAVARPAGGTACQATFALDHTAAGTVSTTIANKVPIAAGSYTQPEQWTPNVTGNLIVCAWLEQDAGTSTANIAGPVTTPVTVRGPQVTALSLGASSPIIAGQSFTIGATTQVDQPLRLYGLARAAATGACAASYEQDVAAHKGSRLLFRGTPVSGGPTTSQAVTKLAAGSYVICAWVEGPTSGEVDAATSAPLTVAAPAPTPKPKPSAGLSITHLSATAGGAVTVSGATTAGYLGTVKLVAKCGKATSTGAASAANGAWSASLATPKDCVAGKTLLLSAQTPASTYAAGTAKNSVVVAAATTTPTKPGKTHGRKPVIRTLFTQTVRHGKKVTNEFRTRPPRILVASTTHLVLKVKWTRWGRNGGFARGTATTRGHGRYPVTVTTGHDIKGTFACLTVRHRVGKKLSTLRLGLGRRGHTLEWVPLRRLHARNSTVKPWPNAGCPAPKR